MVATWHGFTFSVISRYLSVMTTTHCHPLIAFRRNPEVSIAINPAAVLLGEVMGDDYISLKLISSGTVEIAHSLVYILFHTRPVVLPAQLHCVCVPVYCGQLCADCAGCINSISCCSDCGTTSHVTSSTGGHRKITPFYSNENSNFFLFICASKLLERGVPTLGCD